ncbi:MAG TPA: hypothetical protein VF618_18150 [Thermoanaerobaculia bacterium]
MTFDALHQIARLLALAGGGVLIYGGLFLHEDEERQVDNILVDWWVRIHDLQRTAIARHFALMQGAAKLATAAIDRVFGRSLFSRQAIAASVCLSFASVHFSAAYILSRAVETIDRPLTSSADAIWPIAALFLEIAVPMTPSLLHLAAIVAIVGVVAAAVNERLRHAPVVGLTFTLAFVTTHFAVMMMCCSPGRGRFIALVAAVVVGTVTDVVATAATRRLLRWQGESERFSSLMLLAAAQLSLGMALILGPPALLLVAIKADVGPIAGLTAWTVAISTLTNIFSAALTLGLFIAILTLLVHRLIWPLIERPLYRLARFGMFRNAMMRGGMIAIGVEAVGAGAGYSGAVLSLILRLVRGS